MRYYKVVKDGILQFIGTGLGGEEITAEEYEVLSAEIENTDWASFMYEEEE